MGDFMLDTPPEKFVKDFQRICTKNPNVTLDIQLSELRKYSRWFDAPIHRKILYLDSLNEEQKSILIGLNPSFRKWIYTTSALTSVTIESKMVEPTEEPFVEDDPSRTKKSKRGRKLETGTYRYGQYTAKLGRIVSVKTSDDVVIKQHQVWKFEFWETKDYKNFCRSQIIEVTPKTPAPSTEPQIEQLGEDGWIQETSRKLVGFMNALEDNFAEELDIGLTNWSTVVELNNKFRNVRSLRIVHSTPGATNWWMSQIKMMKTIPEITMLRNYNGEDPIEAEYRKTHKFKNCEAMPYIIPFPKREAPVWIFWARKLTFENTIENSITDFTHMHSLAEVNLKRFKLPAQELAYFIRRWGNGDIGHRLERVVIDMDYPSDFTKLREEHEHRNVKRFVGENELSEVFADHAKLETADVYLLQRVLTIHGRRKYHITEHSDCSRAESGYSSYGSGSDRGASSEGSGHSSPIPDSEESQSQYHTYGGYAVLELSKDNKRVVFTAVRDQVSAKEAVKKRPLPIEKKQRLNN
ncbi:hypothetical protein GCK72_000553 [Caenorhabditis remanei]|uniref:F-box associated domain-containing protein n=1 Tax=Caenorhabditis remanei TaxID=31234 RepID=A0A6A5HKN5_CAERE|nr:hypothetical protein GCK72_000553 [Caenorhabditis remanei]KAF1768740.1 hypothetical protein GCK72_000553 [Caenorhabditis remanei]